MQIDIDGIPAEVVRKRIRTLRLTVLPPDGRVRISAPMLLPKSAITAFALSKADWIRKQQQKMRSRPLAKELQYVSGETVPVWGREYTLYVTEGSRWSVTPGGDMLLLTAAENSTREQREARMTEWYREQLKAEAGKRLPEWEKRTGLYCGSWQTKNMKTRWGTCNSNARRIWLSVQLAKKPVECLDYVILHELTHLKVRNHGKDFWQAVERYMPDWRERRKLLK